MLFSFLIFLMLSLLQLHLMLTLALGITVLSHAIEVSPTVEQQREAVEKGKSAAQTKTPPNELYWRFGSSDGLRPHGFIMTKLGGLAVLSAHFSFRSEIPSEEDINRITKESALQVSVTVFGASPDFAVDSYILFRQGERLIKPVRVRSDAHAHRSEVWPHDPPYRAKVVASFPYDTFDPLLPTTVSVFPGEGGEIPFELDFSAIP